MRRDLFVGMTVSLLVHAGFAFFMPGHPPAAKLPLQKEDLVAMVMPPSTRTRRRSWRKRRSLRPVPTRHRIPARRADACTPGCAAPAIEPPPPDGVPKGTTITIPTGPRPSGKGLGEIFDPKGSTSSQSLPTKRARPIPSKCAATVSRAKSWWDSSSMPGHRGGAVCDQLDAARIRGGRVASREPLEIPARAPRRRGREHADAGAHYV